MFKPSKFPNSCLSLKWKFGLVPRLYHRQRRIKVPLDIDVGFADSFNLRRLINFRTWSWMLNKTFAFAGTYSAWIVFRFVFHVFFLGSRVPLIPVRFPSATKNSSSSTQSFSSPLPKPHNLSHSSFFSSICFSPLSHTTSPTHGSNDNVSLPCLPLSTRGPF